MEVHIVPLEDILATKPCSVGEQQDFDAFSIGIESCLMNCQKETKYKDFRGAFADSDPFTLKHVATSAGAGCRGCQFLQVLLECTLRAYSLSDHLEDLMLQWIGPVGLLQVTRKDIVQKIQLFYPKKSRVRVKGISPSNVLSGDTNTSISLEWARQRIRECEALHQTCGFGRDVPLPTRLLHATTLGNGEIKVRLEITQGRRGTYATLSHCWGDPALIRSQSTQATIGRYCDSIPWEELTRSFQDAVTLTLRLGLEYLWIDSLCILQDSRDDWDKESSIMGDVYHNSYVTIAAAWSRESKGGCFSKTSPDICMAFKDTAQPEVPLIGARACLISGKAFTDAEYNVYNPLFDRAWVYQERLLSRRILFCSRKEFEVGCQEAHHCECGNRGLEPHFWKAGDLNLATHRKSFGMSKKPNGDGLQGFHFERKVYKNWFQVVEGYAKLSLTNKNDKLPALSAVAKLAMRNIPGEYLAGIWRGSLMEGLLWYVKGRLSIPRPRGKDWRAPSWSWVSVDSPSGLAHLPIKGGFSDAYYGKIKAAECTLAGSNALGQVTSGFIRLDASLFPTFWRIRCQGCSSRNRRTNRTGTPRANYTLHVNEVRPTLRNMPPCSFAEPELIIMGAECEFFADAFVDKPEYYGFVASPGPGTCQLAPCHLLHVPRNDTARRAERIMQKDKIDAGAFLVLMRTSVESETYKRIGLATLGHKNVERKSTWFQQVWATSVSPEKTITLL